MNLRRTPLALRALGLLALPPLLLATLLGSAALLGVPVAEELPPERLERFVQMSERSHQRIADTPFVGVTTDGEVEAGLFGLRSTGVSTEPVRAAAAAFLEGLTDDQRARSTFAVDDDEWRRWMNQHFYRRAGVSFEEMDDTQRDLAFTLLRTSLSAKGLELSRDIMRLNHTLGELAGNNFAEFGEWMYHITVMGEPSSSGPWGWQLDGHHLIVNYFVLGDQVVMTPTFVGSEPVIAEAGKFAGTAILQEEQAAGLAFMRSLPRKQQEKATLETEKNGNHNQGEALQDNLVLPYEGLAAKSLSKEHQQALLDLVRLYVGNLRDAHAKVWMEDVAEHLDRTHFAWIGKTDGPDDELVYYYRIHSPVILIEFDHQRPANLRHILPPVPNRQHIHALVRTPNGNDYGKDLLRLHLEQHPH